MRSSTGQTVVRAFLKLTHFTQASSWSARRRDADAGRGCAAWGRPSRGLESVRAGCRTWRALAFKAGEAVTRPRRAPRPRAGSQPAREASRQATLQASAGRRATARARVPTSSRARHPLLRTRALRRTTKRGSPKLAGVPPPSRRALFMRALHVIDRLLGEREIAAQACVHLGLRNAW